MQNKRVSMAHSAPSNCEYHHVLQIGYSLLVIISGLRNFLHQLNDNKLCII